ncbi:flagellar hook-length control protein FliK [Leptospira biflexa]|uniref:flagellar hook-length control protein FliK n=1 Tax=Leptospira biflexa TaxID=172 RepID=UPI00108260CF|nr:flagellar hook-length control protein FliK [Leptospira biflexa]TGM35032.1 flagellar hook-length control protein FliK [Leptospira biflexa]TGM38535.1 flagellar hook-length control protein FliK [Leptospira biflexa]
MNVNVDKQNLIPFPQTELRVNQRDGANNNYFAVKESFGEILEREFQIHSDKPKSASDWKPLHADSNLNEPETLSVSNREVENQTTPINGPKNPETEFTSSQKSKEESTEETSEEEDLDREALEYSIGILSNHSLWEKQNLPANEGNDSLQKEKTIALSLQKSAEKNSLYGNKESKSFLEETKKLAENFLKTELLETKQNLISNKQSFADKIPNNLLSFPGSQKKIQSEKLGNDSKTNPNPVSQKLENVPSGFTLAESFLQKGKQIRGVENESQSEGSLRKLDSRTKTNKNQKSEFSFTDSFTEKENGNVSITSDKMIRSLGLKEKEFQKQNENKNQVLNEKQKIEQTLVNQIQNVSSSKMGEENGKSSDERGTKQGFNLHSVENKLHTKSEEVKTLERNQKPKENNLKQNLDELIKQAKFDIVQNGKSSAEIIMNPKEYGRLTLQVSVDGEKVEGRILVESEELQKSLQNEIQTIKENLKESGLDLQALIIDLWDDGSQLADRQNQNELYQTLMETAKNRGKMGMLEQEEGLDLEGIPLPQDSKVLEFFA